MRAPASNTRLSSLRNRYCPHASPFDAAAWGEYEFTLNFSAGGGNVTGPDVRNAIFDTYGNPVFQSTSNCKHALYHADLAERKNYTIQGTLPSSIRTTSGSVTMRSTRCRPELADVDKYVVNFSSNEPGFVSIGGSPESVSAAGMTTTSITLDRYCTAVPRSAGFPPEEVAGRWYGKSEDGLWHATMRYEGFMSYLTIERTGPYREGLGARQMEFRAYQSTEEREPPVHGTGNERYRLATVFPTWTGCDGPTGSFIDPYQFAYKLNSVTKSGTSKTCPVRSACVDTATCGTRLKVAWKTPTEGSVESIKVMPADEETPSGYQSLIVTPRDFYGGDVANCVWWGNNTDIADTSSSSSSHSSASSKSSASSASSSSSSSWSSSSGSNSHPDSVSSSSKSSASSKSSVSSKSTDSSSTSSSSYQEPLAPATADLRLCNYGCEGPTTLRPPYWTLQIDQGCPQCRFFVTHDVPLDGSPCPPHGEWIIDGKVCVDCFSCADAPCNTCADCECAPTSMAVHLDCISYNEDGEQVVEFQKTVGVSRTETSPCTYTGTDDEGNALTIKLVEQHPDDETIKYRPPIYLLRLMNGDETLIEGTRECETGMVGGYSLTIDNLCTNEMSVYAD